MPRRAPEAALLRVGGRLLSELLAHLAVLLALAHPLLNMLVQLAPRDAALSAVDLAARQDGVDCALLAVALGDQGACETPDPFHVVGTGPAR